MIDLVRVIPVEGFVALCIFAILIGIVAIYRIWKELRSSDINWSVETA